MPGTALLLPRSFRFLSAYNKSDSHHYGTALLARCSCHIAPLTSAVRINREHGDVRASSQPGSSAYVRVAASFLFLRGYTHSSRTHTLFKVEEDSFFLDKVIIAQKAHGPDVRSNRQGTFVLSLEMPTLCTSQMPWRLEHIDGA